MALPLLAAGAAVARYIASKGIRKAIKKYGEKAVMEVGKNRSKVTKAEKTAGRGGSVPTRKPNVQGSKMPGGTRMPPNKLDVKTAQAARRAANKKAQFGRGASTMGKAAAGGAGAGATAGVFVNNLKKNRDNQKSTDGSGRNQAEVARLKRVGQRSAFKQAGEREAKKADLAKMPAQAKAASGAKRAARNAAKKKAEQERAKKMSTTTKVTAPRSAVKETRESIRGPNARPASKLAGPPTPRKSDLKSSGTSTAPKGDIRTPTAAIVGEKSTGATGAKNNPTTVRGGQKRAERQGKKGGTGTFIGKDGRKKAAVTREELEKSGLSLRDYLNKQRGLTRRKPNKKAKGGKVKAYKNGGTVRGAGKATKGIRPCKMR